MTEGQVRIPIAIRVDEDFRGHGESAGQARARTGGEEGVKSKGRVAQMTC
jgi:hypothetical protein